MQRGFPPSPTTLTVLCLLVGGFGADTVAAVFDRRLPFDVPLARWLQGIDWGRLAGAFEATNWGGSGWHSTAIVAACLAACAAVVGPRALMLPPAALASGFTALLKNAIDRPRPGGGLVDVHQRLGGFSYPSGHATFFAWLAVSLVLALSPRLGRRSRVAGWILASLLVAVACGGRVWAGVHWPSDVLGGTLLGSAWALLVAIGWEATPYLRWKSRPPA